MQQVDSESFGTTRITHSVTDRVVAKVFRISADGNSSDLTFPTCATRRRCKRAEQVAQVGWANQLQTRAKVERRSHALAHMKRMRVEGGIGLD